VRSCRVGPIESAVPCAGQREPPPRPRDPCRLRQADAQVERCNEVLRGQRLAAPRPVPTALGRSDGFSCDPAWSWSARAPVVLPRRCSLPAMVTRSRFWSAIARRFGSARTRRGFDTACLATTQRRLAVASRTSLRRKAFSFCRREAVPSLASPLSLARRANPPLRARRKPAPPLPRRAALPRPQPSPSRR
jgi:hypothetical protein